MSEPVGGVAPRDVTHGEVALPPALVGGRLTVAGPTGHLTLYAAGSGSPLLLVHSINAAASAAEVRPLHDYYRTRRRVYSVDLPGYGHSERSDVAYSPRIMTDALLACIRAIRDECADTPVDVLALSLSCEYLARAAAESSNLFRSVALVSPTGFQRRAVRRAPAGTTRGSRWAARVLEGPGWGGGLFGLLTRPAVIRYFLRRTWGSKNIDEQLWQYDVLTARQPAAEFAPLRFLSGYLFSADIHTVYEALTIPVWMSHGVRGDFTDYGGQSLLALGKNWCFTTFPTGALPHFEVCREFCGRYDEFLSRLA